MRSGAFARRLASLVLVSLIIGACASGIQLQFKRPKQIAFAGIKRLVVAPVTGIKQRHQLEEKLVAALAKTGFYQVLRDADIHNVMQKYELSYDDIAAADSAKLNEIAGWLEADGILFCELKTLDVDYMALGKQKVEKLVWTGEYERDKYGEIIEVEDSTGAKVKKKKLKVMFVDQKFQLRDAKGEAIFRLIDFQTGGMIGTWNKEEHIIEDIVEGDKSTQFRAENEIRQTLLNKIVQGFVEEIAPKVQFMKLELATGIAELDSGIAFARQNKWHQAIEVWQRAEGKYPNNAGIYYNIGIGYEAIGDLKLAQQYFLKAKLIDPKNKNYERALQRIQKIWAEKERLLVH